MTSSEEELVSMEHYERKTFYKTASLMANSSKAVALLGGASKEVSDIAWDYGRHLGLAFQVGRLSLLQLGMVAPGTHLLSQPAVAVNAATMQCGYRAGSKHRLS
jgi:Polyprenyl synthetase